MFRQSIGVGYMDVLLISGKHMNSVWHERLFTKLSVVNIKGFFLNIIKDMYSKSSCAVKVSDKRTDFFDCRKGVRQGCPLSPTLFNIYINDLLYQLDDQNPEPLEISKSVMISCLECADDIKTATRLQKTLQTLESSCTTWQMAVNTEKTKSITFQKKNRVNKNDIFHFNEKLLTNAAEFVYVSLKIDAIGSLQNSLKLCEKAMRACFALNNKRSYGPHT